MVAVGVEIDEFSNFVFLIFYSSWNPYCSGLPRPKPISHPLPRFITAPTAVAGVYSPSGIDAEIGDGFSGRTSFPSGPYFLGLPLFFFIPSAAAATTSTAAAGAGADANANANADTDAPTPMPMPPPHRPGSVSPPPSLPPPACGSRRSPPAWGSPPE
ncbi:hypothetical protein BHM03_00012462 [Ensete ventricosum]|uniref:Uncharacterized protein n=1 Tax=Ensete ventricosum TaxID=4639 RepID=A0A445MDG2_ENSVE|nr:hypothetical protein BHM03_00012462 [Ensete ventricosum]